MSIRKFPKKMQTEQQIVATAIQGNTCNISWRGFVRVPIRALLKYPEIEVLNLNHNSLRTIGNEFAQLTNLTSINLSENSLTTLPFNFGCLKNLRFLDLSENNIQKIPLSFGRLINLRFLDMKGNPLHEQLRDVVGSCESFEACEKCARGMVRYIQQEDVRVKKQLVVQNLRKLNYKNLNKAQVVKSAKVGKNLESNAQRNKASNEQSQKVSIQSIERKKKKKKKKQTGYNRLGGFIICSALFLLFGYLIYIAMSKINLIRAENNTKNQYFKDFAQNKYVIVHIPTVKIDFYVAFENIDNLLELVKKLNKLKRDKYSSKPENVKKNTNGMNELYEINFDIIYDIANGTVKEISINPEENVELPAGYRRERIKVFSASNCFGK